MYKDSGEQYFASLEDYLNRVHEPIVSEAVKQYLSLAMPGLDTPDAELPENQFLIRFGYVDDKLRLINEDGHLVDVDGNLVNEDGFYVNKKGERVDVNGRLLDENNDYVVEQLPFLDDDDNPIED